MITEQTTHELKISMRTKLDMLSELLPQFTIEELKYIFNICKRYSYADRRNDLITKDYPEELRDERAISFNNLDKETFKWCIEKITGKDFSMIYTIVKL
jgi:hypothetical protein